MPLWSMLPPLELRGLGTPLVESIDHYLVRLAEACASTPQRIVQRAMLAYGDAWKPHASFRTAGVVAGLTELTRTPHLASGTLIKLVHVLAPSARQLRSRKWCPKCYQHWSHESWEPMFWTIPYTSLCALHEVMLESHCRMCGAAQPLLSVRDERTRCFSCKIPLGFDAKPAAATPLARWVDNIILDLIEMCGDPDTHPVPRENMVLLRRHLIARPMSNCRSIEMRKFRSKYITSNCIKLPLRTLINLCALQSVRPRALLLTPAEAFSPTLFPEFKEIDQLPLGSPETRECDRAVKTIQRLLSDPDAPLLPFEIALQLLGVDRRMRLGFGHLRADYRQAIGRQEPWPSSTLTRRLLVAAYRIADTSVSTVRPGSVRTVSRHLSEVHSVSPKLSLRGAKAAIQLVRARNAVDRELHETR